MKEGKKKFLITAGILFVISMLFCFCRVGGTAQASATQKYKEAYQKLLSQKTIAWGEKKADTSKLYFLLYDIDHNGIPELFIKNPKAGEYEETVRIYTFSKKKNKVKLLYKTSNKIYVYENQSLVCFVGEMTGLNFTRYCVLKEDKLETKLFMTGTIIGEMLPSETEVLEVAPGKADTIYFYSFEADGEEISRDEADAIVRELEKYNKVVNIGKYQKNTKKSRSKI